MLLLVLMLRSSSLIYSTEEDCVLAGLPAYTTHGVWRARVFADVVEYGIVCVHLWSAARR
jgi:hypothetical protein